MSRSEPAAAVAVIGGGVSGVTTALALRLAGVPATLYAHRLPSGPAAPEFASLHAAASILPHSVRSSRVSEWTRASQAFFRVLALRADAGVRSQTHYEVFERGDVAMPPYADAVHDFRRLEGAGAEHRRVPRREGAATVFGWSFDAYFCEAPTYLRYLYAFLEAAGGRVVLTADLGIAGRLADYLALGHRVVVNCTGLGATALLSPQALGGVTDVPGGDDLEPIVDPWEPRIVRGHYLRVAFAQAVVDDRGRFFSYNYTPAIDVYPAADRAADVYCYPRSDAWVLGGSRQPRVVEDGEVRWIGAEPTLGDEHFPGADGATVAVPAPIFTLNAQLMERMTGGAVSLERLRRESPDTITAGVGYRFERAHPDESVRVGWSRVRSEDREAHVIHNYGHGGAGYTLSWGCAGEVLRFVRRLDLGLVPDEDGFLPDLPAQFGGAATMLRALL